MDNQLNTTKDKQVLINKVTSSLVNKLHNKAFAEQAARERLEACVFVKHSYEGFKDESNKEYD